MTLLQLLTLFAYLGAVAAVATLGVRVLRKRSAREASRRLKPLWYNLGGIVSLVLGMLLVGTAKEWTALPIPIVALGFLAGMGFLAIGWDALRTGSRVSAPAAERVLEEDERPPVLYLRGFDLDAAPGPERPFKDLAAHAVPDMRHEELFAPALWDIGPVIAIARPGEALPELGAARLPVEGEAWRQKVLDLMGRARFVIFATGTSPGLLWEIQQAGTVLPPSRMLIFFADFGLDEARREARYREFREVVRPILPADLPESIGDAIWIAFTEEWEPLLFGPPSRSIWDWENRAQAALVRALDEVSPEYREHRQSIGRMTVRDQYRHLIAADRPAFTRTVMLLAAKTVAITIAMLVATYMVFPEYLLVLGIPPVLLFVALNVGIHWHALRKLRRLRYDP